DFFVVMGFEDCVCVGVCCRRRIEGLVAAWGPSDKGGHKDCQEKGDPLLSHSFFIIGHPGGFSQLAGLCLNAGPSLARWASVPLSGSRDSLANRLDAGAR